MMITSRARQLLHAPAKLNLFLHVNGQRADGYHNIQSLFVPISLYDEIYLSEIDGTDIERESDDGIPFEEDLVVRAARLLQPQLHESRGVRIGIHKQIPYGAGLGGGSSDAAAVLMGLNRLWSLGLRKQELADLGLKLGADVPFFVTGQPALVSGVGEEIEELSPWQQLYFVLISPQISVSTKDIFTHPHLQRDTPVLDFEEISNALGDYEAVVDLMARTHNDLQEPAFLLQPDLRAMTEMIRQELQVEARMTGSGSNFFVLCRDEEGAGLLKSQMDELFVQRSQDLSALGPIQTTVCCTIQDMQSVG